MPRADRLLALVRILSGPRRRSLAELVTQLGASPRTIYRDLCSLESRGIAVERVEGAYRLLESSAVPTLHLSPQELILLTLALENPSFSRQPGYRRVLSQLRAKLAGSGAVLPAGIVALAGPETTGEIAPEIIAAIESAIDKSHSLSIHYTSLSSGATTWRSVEPWGLVHRSGAWYLVGHCAQHREPRTFRLDRIRAVLPIGTSFEPPRHFSPARWFEASWGALAGGEAVDCVIVFESDVAPLMRYARFHESESKRVLTDGSLEYRVRVVPADDLARWIAGFGGAARALEPLSLARRVATIASGAAAAHEPKSETADSSEDEGRDAQRAAGTPRSVARALNASTPQRGRAAMTRRR